MLNLRGGIHDVLERWKDGEKPFWYELKVAVSHVVHEINVCYITKERHHGGCSTQHCCQNWYCK